MRGFALACLVMNAVVAAAPPEEVAALRVSTGGEARPIHLPALLGGNIAMWYQPEQMVSDKLRSHFEAWEPALVRLPGGSWSDEIIWNGNGVRRGDHIDLSKRDAGGWTIDYSGYAPGFRLQADPARPGAIKVADYHGNLDVRILHEFIHARRAAAVVTVNMGTGTPEMAAEWLKWTKREGYDVAYWEIGNELDGEWELGHIMTDGKRMTDADYARRFKEFEAALKAVDPSAKVGGPASSNDQLLFVETLIREAGDTLDFISFHTYPVLGGNTPEAARFAQADDVKKAVERIRGWIRQYHPARAGQIEIGITEWHKQVAETRPTVDLSSGLWACLFIGAMADAGVSFANIWDCYSQTETGGHGLFDGKSHVPRAVFHAMMLWRRHMHDLGIEVTGGDESLRAFATKDGARVALMVVNTSPDQARKFSVRMDDQPVGGSISAVRLSSHEYLWNPHNGKPEWSSPPAEVVLESRNGLVEIPPFSAFVLRLGEGAVPLPSSVEMGEPEMAILLPETSSADLPVEGFVVVRRKGTNDPWHGSIGMVELAIEGPARMESPAIRMNGPVGTFTLVPGGAGVCTVNARAGTHVASDRVAITAVEERKEILWTFSDEKSLAGMESSYTLALDQQVRPNQAVAAVRLKDAMAREQKNTLLAINALPATLDKNRIGGVVALVGASPDLSCADAGASVQVVLQSNNDHWIPLGEIKLSDLAAGKKDLGFHGKGAAFRDAMPELYSLRFMLSTSEPVTGTIHFDDIGVILRSE